MPDQKPEPANIPDKNKGSKVTQYAVIAAVLALILGIILLSTFDISISPAWLLVIAALAVIYAVYRKYERKQNYTNIYRIINEVRQKEFKERGITLNVNIDNIEAEPIAPELTYVYFRDEAVGYIYHVFAGIIGKSSKDISEMMQTYNENQLNRLLAEKGVKPLDIYTGT